MIRLYTDDVIKLHKYLIHAIGGTAGIRDYGMLDSAVNSPFASYDGIDLFPTILDKAARLGYGITCNHPFVDGNKRTGAHSMLLFLKANDISAVCQEQELIELFFGIAQNNIDVDGVKTWLEAHTYNIKRAQF